MISGTFNLRQRPARRAGGRTTVSSLPAPELSARGEFSSRFEDRASGSSITYTGALYNYSELRRELELRGCRFTSRLESELILRAYSAWGPGCLEKLNGQWAFALWDAGRKRLFCSRDRFGLRTFYYHYGSGGLSFASRIESLLSLPGVPRSLNDRAVFDFLVLNHNNQPEETFFRDIRKLPAGHLLSLSAPRKPEIKRYYAPRVNPELGQAKKKDVLLKAEEFRHILTDAVRIRTAGVKGLGSMLSGGLDSSSITCLAARLLRGRGGSLKTFSVHWTREKPYILASSKKTGLPHIAIPPASFSRISWREMAEVAAGAEKPVNDTSVLGEMKLLSTAAAGGCSVLLDGSGGDEVLAGYPERHFNTYLNQTLRLKGDAAFSREFAVLFGDRLKDFNLHGAPGPGFWKTFLRTQSIAPELSDILPARTIKRDFLAAHSGRKHPLDSGPRFDLQQALRDDTLALGNELEHIIPFEFRMPLLDHRLVDYAFSLPGCYKINGGWTKYLLRAAMSGTIPDKVCWRREKVGGTTPVSEWRAFMSRNRRNLKALFSDGTFLASPFVDRKGVLKNFDRLFSQAISEDTTDISGLWRFAALELWLRKHL